MKCNKFTVLAFCVSWMISSVAISAPVATLSGEPGFSKNRYVSFDPTTNGTDDVAIRVKRVGGVEKFVDCRQVVDKGADGFYAKLIDGPLPPPGDTIYYCDWSSVTTGLHVTACNVLPGNLYQVSTTIDGDNFSSVVGIETTPPPVGGAEFGDLVGAFVGGMWTAPDGLLTSSDVIAMSRASQFDPTAPMLARVDLVGATTLGGALLVPDALITSADVDQFNAAFNGQPFGFGVTGCLTGTCVPPVDCGVIVIPNAPLALSGEPGFTKDRYVSVNPSANGNTRAAIQVTRVGSTTDKFVDCTTLEDLGPDGWYAVLIDGPLPAPGDTTYYCDMGAVTSGLHMRGCSIVPGNTYDISMTFDGIGFSPALAVQTTVPQFAAGRQFGDIVGSLVAGEWTPPDGLVTGIDIVAVVKKFNLSIDAPIISRVDNGGALPNTIVSAAEDVLRAVQAFSAEPFGYGVTDCLTGTCIPPQGGACE